MKKYLWQYLWIVLWATVLVSCGKDDKVLPYDPNYVAGDYEGTCVIAYGTKNHTDGSFPIRFDMDGSNGAALRGSLGNERTWEEDGLGYIANQLTNFENHGYATFRVSNITVPYIDKIPEFVNKLTDAFKVKSASLTLTCEKGGRFDPNKQEISFVYKGKVETVGTQSYDKLSISISYSFVLKKKR